LEDAFMIEKPFAPRANLRLTIGLTLALVGSLLPLTAAMAAGVHLSFTGQPPNPATAGVAFPVTVHVQDDAAAPLNGVSVTLDVAPANNPGGDTLTCASGTTVVSNASGNALCTRPPARRCT